MSPDVGIYLPQVSLTFTQVLERAHRVEALGFGSFWIYDHLYTPMLPDHDALEGWTLATALLSRTSRLRVGHLVLDNNLRHPAVLAQMIATLDGIADGRFDLGIGSGSYPLEHEQAGIAFGTFAERSARLGEALTIIDQLLTTGTCSFTGEHYTVDGLPCRPGPVQQPHPPVHIGGMGERCTLPLVARFADVWNVPTYGLDRWEATATVLESTCASIDRDPASLATSHQAVLVLAADDAALAEAKTKADRRYAGPGWNVDAGGYVGTPAALVDHLGTMRERGVGSFIFLPSDRGDGDMLELLAHDVLPQLS